MVKPPEELHSSRSEFAWERPDATDELLAKAR
jgi:hypothetical protein